MHYAYVGDSRLLVIGEGGIQQLTTYHRGGEESERLRIQEYGGVIAGQYVVKGEYGFMPTRTLGDAYFRDVGVIPGPESEIIVSEIRISGLLLQLNDYLM
ncbi:MAG: PP2C family serine/threonine-protein phosphatase [Patescibacteria group bacterium]